MGLCNVETCSNKSGTPGVRTVSFPSNPELRLKWITAIDNQINDLNSVKFPRICSAHFDSSCWDRLLNPPALVPGSIPSIFCRCLSQEQANTLQRGTATTVGRTNSERTSRNGGRPKRTDKINHFPVCPFYPRSPCASGGEPENLDPNAATLADDLAEKDEHLKTFGQWKQDGGPERLASRPASSSATPNPRIPSQLKQNAGPENIASRTSDPSDNSSENQNPRIHDRSMQISRPKDLALNASAPTHNSSKNQNQRIPDQLKENGRVNLALNASIACDDSCKNRNSRIPYQFKQDGKPKKMTSNASARPNHSSGKRRKLVVSDVQFTSNDVLGSSEQDDRLCMFWFDSLIM